MVEVTNAEREILKKAGVVLLLRYYDEDGEQVYAYVSARGDKFLALRNRQGNIGEPFDLQEYGTVIAFGNGDPAPDVMEYMEREWGFNHEKMLDIRADGGE